MKKDIFSILSMLLLFVCFDAGETAAEIKITEFESGKIIYASEVNANFTALKDVIEQLQTRIIELQTQYGALEEENRGLKATVTNLQANIQVLEQRIDTILARSSSEVSPKEIGTVPVGVSISLRSKPLTVSEETYKEVYNLDGNGRPREYISNEFDVQGDVVIDRATGLMWQQSGSGESVTYEQAQQYVDKLNRQQFAGYTDWRLPTIPELLSLVEPTQKNGDLYIDQVFDATQRWCWSADKRTKDESSAAWGVNFNFGSLSWSYLYVGNFVRAVRS